MQFSDVMLQRKSTRAFLNKPIELEKIHNILDLSGHAPSGVNTQPWDVAIVQGETKKQLDKKLENAFRSGIKANMDYQYYPKKWLEPYKSRRKACGLQMYSVLDIAREDKQKQQDQWAANYRAFDAPVVLFFFLNEYAQQGSYLDYGMFLQSLMLAAVDQGLATCPQAALTEYPQIVKEILSRDESQTLICGMALGYEDKQAVINSYRTEREAFSSFSQFFD